jgi:hypothetical protein
VWVGGGVRRKNDVRKKRMEEGGEVELYRKKGGKRKKTKI